MRIIFILGHGNVQMRRVKYLSKNKFTAVQYLQESQAGFKTRVYRVLERLNPIRTKR